MIEIQFFVVVCRFVEYLTDAFQRNDCPRAAVMELMMPFYRIVSVIYQRVVESSQLDGQHYIYLNKIII